MNLDLARLEPPKVGEIITTDSNYAEWKINWSQCINELYSCSDEIPSVSSPNFSSSIGTCWFRIRRLPTNYKVSLLTLFTENKRRIRLSVKGSDKYITSEWMVESYPSLVFDGSVLVGSDVFRITYIAVDTDVNVAGRNDSRIIVAKPTLTQKDWNGKLPRGWIAEEEAMPKDTQVPPNAAGAEGTGNKAPKSKGMESEQGGQGASSERTRKQEELRAKSAAKLIENLGDLLLNGTGDVPLKVEGEELRAHKFMLIARSPTLKKLFEEERVEKNVLTLEIDKNVFMDFLRYIHTAIVELSIENAHLLYVAAVRYELLELKEECLEYMKGNVFLENFFDILEVSLRHSEEELYEIVARFYEENAKIITDRADFMAFMGQNPKEAQKLILRKL